MMAVSSGPYVHALLTGPPGVGKTTLIKRVCALVAQKKKVGCKMSGFYTEEVREGGGRVGFDVVTLEGERAVLARVPSISQGQSVTGGAAGTSRRVPTVGRYQVNVTSFESLALPTLEYIHVHVSTKPTAPSSGVTRASRVPDSTTNKTTATGSKMALGHSDTETNVKSVEQEVVLVRPGPGNHLVVIDEIGKMELFSKRFADSVKRLFENESKRAGVVVLATIPVAGRGKSHWLLEQLRHRGDCRLFQVTEKNRDTLVQEISEFILQRLYRSSEL